VPLSNDSLTSSAKHAVSEDSRNYRRERRTGNEFLENDLSPYSLVASRHDTSCFSCRDVTQQVEFWTVTVISMPELERRCFHRLPLGGLTKSILSKLLCKMKVRIEIEHNKLVRLLHTGNGQRDITIQMTNVVIWLCSPSVCACIQGGPKTGTLCFVHFIKY